jgi:Fur family transcriptional regulator, ferric uptake regulator
MANASSRADLMEALRSQGLRVTSQRRLVLEALQDADDHVSAEEIFDRIHANSPQINISTVYRTLEALEDAGIVYHSHLGHSMGQWHIVREEAHQHLVCELCGSVQRVGLEAFLPYQRALEKLHGFRADPRHFAVFGRCRECLGLGP